MHLWQTNPFQSVVMTRGEGCTLWDASGKPYLDMLSGTWCAVLGHSHPRWLSVIQRQAAKLTHTGAAFVTDEIAGALRKLEEILPPELNRAVFLNTGSEAVELALKMARAATGADGIVVTQGAYYGATTYAMALSEAGRTAGYLPQVGGIHRLLTPDCRRCSARRSWPCDARFPCLDALAELADRGGKSVAAVLYEPVMGQGIIVPPSGYGARLRALTSQCNALLIAEEVTTGMGRTGRWFGFEHENIVPDILVIGKAIGAGLPISAVVTTEEVEDRCRDTLGRHVQSHQNDPFSGCIAAAVISILQDEGLVEQAAERGGYLSAGLRELQADGPWICDVRGRGAMVGAELHQDWSGKGTELGERLLQAGFIVDYHAPTSTFRFFPPFVVSKAEIDGFLQTFRRHLSSLDGG